MEGVGTLHPAARQGEAVLGKVQEDIPLAGLGTEGHLDHLGREQKGGLVGDHHRRGSHMEAELGNPHPEVGSCHPGVGTVDHGTHRTQEGNLIWT